MNLINQQAISKFVLFVVLATFSVTCYAQDDDVLSFDRQFPTVWSGTFEAPVAKGEFFTVYNLFLISAYNSEQGPQFHRLSLGGKIEENTPEPLEVKDLPEGFQLEAFEINPFTQQVIIAGKTASETNEIYTAGITPKGDLGEFVKLPIEKEFADVSFQQILFSGPWVFLLYDAPIGDVQKEIGGAIKLVTEKEELEWFTIPAPKKTREDATFLMGSDGIYLVGGTILDELNPEKIKRTAIQTEKITFTPPNFSPWNYIPIPGSSDLAKCHGTNYGSALFVAPKVDLADEKENVEPEQGVIYFALDRADSNPTSFFRVKLDFPQENLKHLVVDPSHSWLLVMSQGENPEQLNTVALKLPKSFTAKPISEKMIRLKEMEKVAAQPHHTNLTDTLNTARDKNKYALVVIGSGEYEEDILIRTEMTASRFRYTVQNTQMTYLTGDEASEAVEKYEVDRFPAFLLVDPDGNIVSSHLGSIPPAPKLMEMTRTTRVGFGPNADKPAESTDN